MHNLYFIFERYVLFQTSSAEKEYINLGANFTEIKCARLQYTSYSRCTTSTLYPKNAD